MLTLSQYIGDTDIIARFWVRQLCIAVFVILFIISHASPSTWNSLPDHLKDSTLSPIYLLLHASSNISASHSATTPNVFNVIYMFLTAYSKY